MITRPSVYHLLGRPRRSRTVPALAATAMATAAALFAVVPAPPASGAGPRPLPADLAEFAHCPVDVKGVATCLFSSTSSTTFDIGSTVVSSTTPTTISLGLVKLKSGGVTAVLPDDGSQALQTQPIPLPGGLLGVPGVGTGDLAVSVTPQLVGTPTVDLDNLIGGSGPGLSMPLDVLVSTPSGLLGSDCTIASSTTPILLNLTTGTTDPPAPNTPITGSPGTLASTDKGLLTDSGLTLVDNSFAVPGASNCGTGGILDEILNLDKSLPSAAGKNTAILSGTSYAAPAKLIRRYLH
jgi:hypothetical protein